MVPAWQRRSGRGVGPGSDYRHCGVLRTGGGGNVGAIRGRDHSKPRASRRQSARRPPAGKPRANLSCRHTRAVAFPPPIPVGPKSASARSPPDRDSMPSCRCHRWSMIVRSNTRLVAIDHLRGFVIALVVLHHAILAYCTFDHLNDRFYLLSTAPVIDPRRWFGFDIVVVLNDSFFMPLMFLLSGLFVWRGLSRKGGWLYMRDRLRRLGLPFAVAVLTVIPVAYYPSWLQSGGAPGFMEFWRTMLTTGPWPSGPAWFVGILLLFDVVATCAFALFGHTADGPVSTARPAPGACFALLLAGSLLAYLPFLAAFGPSRWLSLGPVAVQGSRIGLYAAWFVAGVAFGADNLRDDRSRFAQMLTRQWPGWTLLAAFIGVALIGAVWRWPGLRGIALACFCAGRMLCPVGPVSPLRQQAWSLVGQPRRQQLRHLPAALSRGDLGAIWTAARGIACDRQGSNGVRCRASAELGCHHPASPGAARCRNIVAWLATSCAASRRPE